MHGEGIDITAAVRVRVVGRDEIGVDGVVPAVR